MVTCSNCGAELPADAVFCEKCGARIQTVAASPPPPPPPAYQQPPPPPAAPPAYPPPAAPPAYPPPATPPAYPPPAPAVEKRGPPMKIIAIGGGIIVILLAAVLFMASSATSGLKMTYQSGRVSLNLATYDITISVNVKVENPSMFSMDIADNRLTIRLKSGGMDATWFSGYVNALSTSVTSGSSTINMNVEVSYYTWATSASMNYVLLYAYSAGLPMEVSITGTLDTKCLFFTGQSTISTGWNSITYGY